MSWSPTRKSVLIGKTMNERTITVNATIKVSEYTLSMIDAFTKEWGLRSRSETIERLLVELFEVDQNAEWKLGTCISALHSSQVGLHFFYSYAYSTIPITSAHRKSPKLEYRYDPRNIFIPPYKPESNPRLNIKRESTRINNRPLKGRYCKNGFKNTK